MLMIAGLVYVLAVSVGALAGALAVVACLAGLLTRRFRVAAAIASIAGAGGAFAMLGVLTVGFLVASNDLPRVREPVWLLWASCGFACGALPTGVLAGGFHALGLAARKRRP